MIAIIDYGMGNLASVYNAFIKMGEKEVLISSDGDFISKADKIVLPGVGAFEDAMKNLNQTGLSQVIRDFIGSGKPFLGFCLGLQLLFEKSYENGIFEGLGVLSGCIRRFEVDLPVPHMGWNRVNIVNRKRLFDSLPENAYYYFDHSYFPQVTDPSIIAGKTDYGSEFVSAVEKDNVMATQFHPEKSHRNGLKLIDNFINL